MELFLGCFLVLEVLGGNLEVARLTVVGRKDSLWLGVWEMARKIWIYRKNIVLYMSEHRNLR